VVAGFSGQIMRDDNFMIPKSGRRFSGQIMRPLQRV